MSGDARQFAIDLDREFAEMMGGVHRAVEYIGLEAVKRVVMKSPVKTGRFRANWALSIGTMDTSTTEQVDKSGGPTIAKAAGAISAYSAMEGFPMVYITNNLPYAQPLEDGHSGQAPSGMVGLTVADLAALWGRIKI